MKTSTLPFVLTTLACLAAPLSAAAEDPICNMFPTDREATILIQDASQSNPPKPISVEASTPLQQTLLSTDKVVEIAPNLYFGVFPDVSARDTAILNDPKVNASLLPYGWPTENCPVDKGPWPNYGSDGSCPVCLLLWCLCYNPGNSSGCFDIYPVSVIPLYYQLDYCAAAQIAQQHYDQNSTK
ncbi:MAG: hypothetical protein AAF449_00555 [Myxococcota bacterium]